MMKISDLFTVTYGVNLEFQDLEIDNKNGIPFVSRTSKNNGVVGFVKKVDAIKPNPPYTISVACGGSVMSSFYQDKEYYSGRDLFYLTPKQPLTEMQTLYYAMCLRANKWKYSYGRQANRTLKDIKIPSVNEIPDYVNNASFLKQPDESSVNRKVLDLNTQNWQYFKLGDLFDIEKGKEIIQDFDNRGNFPCISATIMQNGIAKFVHQSDCKKVFKENCLTVTANGAPCHTFYQEKPFCATTDVNVAKLLHFDINPYIAMFLQTVINKDKYRFSYGRKFGKEKMIQHKIMLPATINNTPDWQFMANYIKSLPCSKSLASMQN